MFSKRSLEGYLLIDDRHSGGSVREQSTLTCSHCHAQVVVGNREALVEYWCAGCDQYICQSCGAKKKAGLPCRPMNAILDTLQEQAFKADGGRGSIVLTDAGWP